MNYHLRALLAISALAVATLAAIGPARAQDQDLEPSARAGEAADRDEIETDRDSFTFATSTVAPRKTVVETSYSFIDNRAGPETHSFPELLARRGVNDWLE